MAAWGETSSGARGEELRLKGRGIALVLFAAGLIAFKLGNHLDILVCCLCAISQSRLIPR